jgi:hypothetical protein
MVDIPEFPKANEPKEETHFEYIIKKEPTKNRFSNLLLEARYYGYPEENSVMWATKIPSSKVRLDI